MFDECVPSCGSRGFLPSGPLPAARTGRPSALAAAIASQVVLSVRACGCGYFAWTSHRVGTDSRPAASAWKRKREPILDRQRVVSGGVDVAGAAFLRAANFYLRCRAPNSCLPRSLAMFAYMRHLVPVMHRIGAGRFPAFRCHAWGEYDGTPILDQRAKVSDYTLIASM